MCAIHSRPVPSPVFLSAEKAEYTHANEAEALPESHYVPSLVAASRTATKPFSHLPISLNESTNTLRGKSAKKITCNKNWDMIRWGCFSSVQISKSDETVKSYYKRGSAGFRLSHRDAWLVFGTISFGQNFFNEIVGTLWSASALLLLSSNPWNYFSPRVWLIAYWQLSTKGRMRPRSKGIGRKLDRSSAI